MPHLQILEMHHACLPHLQMLEMQFCLFLDLFNKSDFRQNTKWIPDPKSFLNVLLYGSQGVSKTQSVTQNTVCWDFSKHMNNLCFVKQNTKWLRKCTLGIHFVFCRNGNLSLFSTGICPTNLVFALLKDRFVFLPRFFGCRKQICVLSRFFLDRSVF